MDGQIQCPACGHELTVYEAPHPSRGERAAATVAARLATWWVPSFILMVVLAWAGWNLASRPFEPYPVIIFAVISGVLSTVAAAQGPLILLAQRRAAMNDRARDEETFHITSRSEADLHLVAAKLDRVLERLGRLEAGVPIGPGAAPRPGSSPRLGAELDPGPESGPDPGPGPDPDPDAGSGVS